MVKGGVVRLKMRVFVWMLIRPDTGLKKDKSKCVGR